MNGLYQRRALALGRDRSEAPIIDPAECATQLQLDARAWAGVAVRTATYFKHLSAARYDPTERLAKHLRWMRANAEIRDGGRPPDQLGIPGLGLTPTQDWPDDWWNHDSAAGRGEEVRADDVSNRPRPGP